MASTGQGLRELDAAIGRHRDQQRASGEQQRRRTRQAEARLRAILVDRLRRRAETALARVEGGLAFLAEEVAGRRLDPYTAVNRLLADA